MKKLRHFQIVKEKFLIGFQWSFTGSVIFEASHIIHHIFLLKALGAQFLGLIGSLFSIIYLTINITDLGFERSVTPYLNLTTQNKASFKKILSFHIFSQILILTIGSLVIFKLYSSIFYNPHQTLHVSFFLILCILEGIRIFFRRFLHNIFFNKATVISEQLLAFAYYAILWIPHYLYKHPITLERVFIFYFLNSLFALLFFLLVVISFYKTLPTNNLILPSNLWRRILKTRIFIYFVDIEKIVLSENFIVPFFANTFGLRQAGIFKIAGIISHSITALIKAAIDFPGNAFLATLKTETIKSKTKAFYTLTDKLNKIIIFISVLLGINYPIIYYLQYFPPAMKSAISYSAVFILTTLVNQLFTVYEQFYNIEEHTNKLFFIKSIEFGLFYILIFANKHITPRIILINMLLIQAFSFLILVIHAYARWSIKPKFKTTKKQLFASIIVSIIISLILRFFI